jgi:hypothetical protein
MKQDDLDKDLRELISDSRSLFGDIEEMDKEELAAHLADSGEPANALRDATYVRVEALVKEMRLRGDDPPLRYLDLLDQLRPASQIPRNPKTLLKHAKRCIDDLLKGPGIGSQAELQFSFRGNKGDLNRKDKEILRDAEERLRRRLRDAQ